MKKLCLAATIFSLLIFCTSFVQAISIRSDQNPLEYQKLALEFPYVGGLSVALIDKVNNIDVTSQCTATLIDRQWIITAAHCVVIYGQAITHATFNLNGSLHSIIGGVVHKNYSFETVPKSTNNQYDIALLRLEIPTVLSNSAPVLVDNPSEEDSDGKTGAIIGYGSTGDGIKGIYDKKVSSTKYAAKNKINILNDRLLSYDFDHHRATNLSNSDTNNQPNILEGMALIGDSGGPIIQGGSVTSNIFGSTPILKGITSWAFLPNACQDRGKEFGAYCYIAMNVRVRAYAGWISDVISNYQFPTDLPIRTYVDDITLILQTFVNFNQIVPGTNPPLYLSDDSLINTIFTAKFTMSEDTFSEEFNPQVFDSVFNDSSRPLYETPNLDVQNDVSIQDVIMLLLM